MKFSNLVGADVTADTTARFYFYDLPGEPWIQVRPGGELNRPYFSAVLTSNTKNRKRLMKGKMDAEMLAKSRQTDRELYPRFIDGGAMGGWTDENGNEVPYSKENFKDLIEQLPADLFDEVRAFCNEPANFREEELPDEDDIEETAGN